MFVSSLLWVDPSAQRLWAGRRVSTYTKTTFENPFPKYGQENASQEPFEKYVREDVWF